MRLSCSFKCDEFPLAYQMLGVSLIKSALESSNSEYAKSIYEFGDKKNKKSKNFCFSVFLNDYEKCDQIFKINGDIIFNFSTPNMEFGINLYNGLLSIDEFKYKGFRLRKQRVFILEEKVITSNEAIFKTQSPIFIKNLKKEHLMPEDDGFENELNYILNLELRNHRGYGLAKPVKFLLADSSLKKKVVKEEISGFENQTSRKTYFINAFSGIFKLCGDAMDLNDIYKLGIGFRRGQGFGMIDVI